MTPPVVELSAAAERGALRGVGARARAWAELTRPRICAMVGFSALVGAVLGAGPGGPFARTLEAALWVSCVAAASGVFNQLLERDTDRLMQRTCRRPLVVGSVRVRDAIFLAALLTLLGTAGLALRFNTLAALLALLTLIAYALVYTPLKRVSTLNTAVGAIPGAMPPLLGFAALDGSVSGWGWFLFASLFAWQFPHFLAIAWLYREDYARAKLRMLPALPGTEGMAGRQALIYALFLLPISLLPAVDGAAGVIYAGGALLLGLVYAAASAAFALHESRRRARAVLLVSIFYLPALYTFVLLDPVVRFTAP